MDPEPPGLPDAGSEVLHAALTVVAGPGGLAHRAPLPREEALALLVRVGGVC